MKLQLILTHSEDGIGNQRDVKLEGAALANLTKDGLWYYFLDMKERIKKDREEFINRTNKKDQQ